MICLKNIFSSLLLSLLCVPGVLAAATVIRFATEASYPPFEYIDQSGEIAGFDIDIAKALCHELKAECSFTNQSFNSLIPALQLGKFDALIAAIGVTQERKKEVNFTNPYYIPSASFVAAIADHQKLNALHGKNVGVQIGTTFDNYLRQKYRDQLSVKPYGSIQDAFLDLVSGRNDLVLTDTPIAQAWLAQGSNARVFSIVEKVITDPIFGDGYAIAVDKNNPDLLKALNQALFHIKKNGIYEHTYKHYFIKGYQ